MRIIAYIPYTFPTGTVNIIPTPGLLISPNILFTVLTAS